MFAIWSGASARVDLLFRLMHQRLRTAIAPGYPPTTSGLNYHYADSTYRFQARISFGYRAMRAFALLLLLIPSVLAQGANCGSQAKGALCPGTQCCGQYGYCGTTKEYCLTPQRRQSRCTNDGPPPPPAGPKPPSIDVSKLYKPPAGTFDNKFVPKTLPAI
ncbi:hypothetical protein FRC12_003472 [Ceratobasidium sp. 428]|nr:hypothetical protein FRC12_003472 [Ceratobasidium sp. 428]